MNTMIKPVILLIFGILLFSLWSCAPAYKTAIAKFDLGEYEKAIPLLQDALSKSQHEHEKGKIHFYIAESYRLSNRMDLAVEPYGKALSEKYFNDKIGLYYGLALKSKGEYELAQEQLERYTRTGTDRELVRRAKYELQHIKEIDSLNKNSNQYITVKNVEGINTAHAEYAPAMMGKRMVFASTRRGEQTYLTTGEGFADLYYFDFQGNSLTDGTVTPFEAEINKDGLHEASATFSPSGKTMIFARSNSGDKKENNVTDVNLYESKSVGGKWTAPILLDYICNEKKWDGSPAFSADGKTLYFASERTDGYGGLDLYYSTQGDRGEWSRPKNLGQDINTPGNDMFPFVDAEGKLYFASDGHPGLGGLDLFVAERENGVISIRNLGKPINSPFDDFALIKKDENSGYFTSNRTTDGAKGNDDIYYFVDETPEIHLIHYLLTGISYGEDNGASSVLPDTKVTLKNANGKVIEEVIANGSGEFSFKNEVEIGKNYLIAGTRGQDYYDKEIEFSTVGKGIDMETVMAPDTTVVLTTEITLKKNQFTELDKEDKITLDNILYDLAKWDIRPDAAKELDKLIEYMKNRPKLKVELGSHTDVRGKDAYNLDLSRKRAQSAVDYIVSQGIDPKRLVAKGYGENDLLIKNAKNEAEHQLNRRTTILVIER